MTEYWIDLPYSSFERAESVITSDAFTPDASMPSYTDPSPTSSQPTIRGTGAQGWWLEVRTTSAISGRARFLPCSRRWNASSAYWSGIVDQLNLGPR